MADTERTLSALQTLLADNTSGAISAQDLRDFLVSAAPRVASYYISSSSATTISVAGTYYKAAGTTTQVGTNGSWSHSTNRLTYTGSPDVDVIVRATVTATCGTSNQVIGLRFLLNATPDTPSTASTARVELLTTPDESQVAVETVFTMSTNDYVELWVTNETATNSVTLDNAYVSVTAVLS